jgi:LuxR family maltose regulon positive regulatory protein
MVDTVKQSTVVRLPHAESPLDIAEAKLLRPPRRRGTVNRPALVDRLIDSRTVPMIAIVAPAGYGKTTLLSDWAERDGRPFAWVSVDEGDVDPVVFLSHIAIALDRVEPLDAGVAPPTRAASFAVWARLSRGAPVRSSWSSMSSIVRRSLSVSTR